jgi:tripeptidyl-peptidase-1
MMALVTNSILPYIVKEACLDVQFALGMSFPTPGTFYSTGGQPPFNPDKDAHMNTNEPYMTVCMRPSSIV